MCWCPFNLVLADNYVKWIRDRWPGCGLPGSSFPSYFRKRQNKLYFAVFYALWHLIYFQSTRVYHWKIAVCPFPDELWVVMFQISVLVLRRNRILYNCYDCYNLLTRASTTVKCIIALVFWNIKMVSVSLLHKHTTWTVFRKSSCSVDRTPYNLLPSLSALKTLHTEFLSIVKWMSHFLFKLILSRAKTATSIFGIENST